jgi:hypothetical protein
MISGIGSAFEYAGTVIDVFNRVVSALQAIWFTGEAVFKGVAAILSNAIAKGAMILDALPDSVSGTGWKEFGASMEASANQLARSAESAAGKAITSAGNVLTGETGGVGKFAGAGPLSTILADGLAKARADAKAPSVAEPIKPQAVQPVAGASTKELKGTDSRSKEGMAEMFRLMRNTGVDIAEQQLEEQRKTNELLSEGDDMEAFGILGA